MGGADRGWGGQRFQLAHGFDDAGLGDALRAVLQVWRGEGKPGHLVQGIVRQLPYPDVGQAGGQPYGPYHVQQFVERVALAFACQHLYQGAVGHEFSMQEILGARYHGQSAQQPMGEGQAAAFESQPGIQHAGFDQALEMRAGRALLAFAQAFDRMLAYQGVAALSQGVGQLQAAHAEGVGHGERHRLLHFEALGQRIPDACSQQAPRRLRQDCRVYQNQIGVARQHAGVLQGMAFVDRNEPAGRRIAGGGGGHHHQGSRQVGGYRLGCVQRLSAAEPDHAVVAVNPGALGQRCDDRFGTRPRKGNGIDGEARSPETRQVSGQRAVMDERGRIGAQAFAQDGLQAVERAWALYVAARKPHASHVGMKMHQSACPLKTADPCRRCWRRSSCRDPFLIVLSDRISVLYWSFFRLWGGLSTPGSAWSCRTRPVRGQA